MSTSIPPPAPTAPAGTDVLVRRALGLVVDVAATSAVGYAIAALAEITSHDDASGGMNPAGHVVVIVLGVIVWTTAFVVIPTANAGRTLGMRLAGVRAVRAEDGGTPSPAQHLVRMLCLVVDGLLSGLVGLVIILNSARRQRLGDMAAHTLVVRDHA